MSIHSKGPLSDELTNNISDERIKKNIQRKLRSFEGKSINLADLVIFPSHSAKELFSQEFKVEMDKKKVKIIYNGIDLNHINNVLKDETIFEQYKINNNFDLILLNIASHSKEKNIDLLLKVVSNLITVFKKKVLLINIGKGELTNKLKKTANDLNIYENVIFLGQLPNNDVIKLMKKIDIFIMTSEKVVFDLALLEALACGASIFVTENGGNKEIIRDGYNGYFFDNLDPNLMAKKIVEADLLKTSKNALISAKKFTIEKMVNEYYSIYNQL